MSQVNVNTPGDRDPEVRESGYGAGLIVGILVAIIIIALLVYFLAFNGGGGGTQTDGGGGTDTEGGGGDAPAPSGWRLVTLA